MKPKRGEGLLQSRPEGGVFVIFRAPLVVKRSFTFFIPTF